MPGAEERREEIEAAMQMAIESGGSRHDPVSLFGLIDTALTGLFTIVPEAQDVVAMGYIRGFAPGDEKHYVSQARNVLDIAEISGPPAISDLCELLKEYLERFLALRQSQPVVALHFFRALALLHEETVSMARD